MLLDKFLERRKRRKELKALREEVNEHLRYLSSEMKKCRKDESKIEYSKQLVEESKEYLSKSADIDRALGCKRLKRYEKYLRGDF